ncbi:YceI family protein [Pedobacter chinensis]|uniref:YceI family protein n=1 Tax=Pedobacter chinensis TaxID=2282421 RepID=A0A369PZ68_9SPHI|nr:YceI family protein [Pedobacter chinensis]RDC55999.1 YceI family protein [Pedobacter chinensis]
MKTKITIMAIVLVIFLLIRCLSANAQNYVSGNVKTSFFSSTPIEDIRAASNKTSAVLIAESGAFAFQVPVKSFEFEKKLMQEHFNENYLESDQYPTASFKGSIEPNINWTKNGEYNVMAKGIFTIHGVGKTRTIPAKISIKDGSVNITSAFDVACADHDIRIPTLVFTKIAKVISVKVNGTLIQKP